MLLPALNSARGKAQDIQCLNNQKSIGFGMIEYDNQNDCGVQWMVHPQTEKLRWQAAIVKILQPGKFNSASNQQYAHIEKVGNLYKAWGIYNCPSLNYMDDDSTKVHPQNYSMNESISNVPYKRTREPSKRIMILDGELTKGKASGQATVSNESNIDTDPDRGGTRISYRHAGKTSSIGTFMDGHSAVLRRSFITMCSASGSSPNFYFWRNPGNTPKEY